MDVNLSFSRGKSGSDELEGGHGSVRRMKGTERRVGGDGNLNRVQLCFRDIEGGDEEGAEGCELRGAALHAHAHLCPWRKVLLL